MPVVIKKPGISCRKILQKLNILYIFYPFIDWLELSIAGNLSNRWLSDDPCMAYAWCSPGLLAFLRTLR